MKMTPKTSGFWDPEIYRELEKRNMEDKRLKPKHLAVIFAVTMLLRVLDWVTTSIALERGYIEANPFQSQLMSMGPLYYFAGQMLGTIAVSLLLWISTRYTSLTEILAFDTILFSVPVLNNLTLILW
uniref:DUF5658 domain-containing protein n=1 Tax=archaeon enrichment culture clone 1(2010) TaxID=795325 RepID=D9CGE9_9ARCH|nr:hypothetical protein pHA1_gp25 [archaeon enrichment culture clone 1(2010)]